MRVNICVGNADLNWIAGRFARELSTRLPKYGISVTINGPDADLEYQQIVYGEPTRRPAVGMFTHGSFRAQRFGMSYDGCIALNPAVHQYLIDAGANSALMEMPVADNFVRPVVFGVAGRTYGDGRKGEHLVAKMVEAGFNVVAWGSGWPCRIVSTDLKDLQRFYKTLNYYVDTSNDEGGCVPALEALAMGIPVISHVVGVTHPVIPYKTHDWDSLYAVLTRLSTPRTYDGWACLHADFFKKVLGV